MSALRQIFAEFGIKWEGSALARGSLQVDQVSKNLREFAEALAGAEMLGAIMEFANSFEEAAGRLEDSARALDVSTDELQQLRFAATAAGVEAEAADAAFARFQRSVAGAASGSKAQASAFRAIGVNVRDASGNVGELSDLMDGVAAGLGNIQDPARRAQIATQLFGTAGARLATVLHGGEGGLADLRAELEELGGGTLPEAIAAAGEYGDAMDRQRIATQGLRSVIAVQLLPVMTLITTYTTRALAAFARWTRDTNTVRVALLALGAAGALSAVRFLASWGPVLLRLGRVAGVVALLALGIDDIITLINGGDSAIGRLLDSIGGLGTQQRFVAEFRQAWEGVGLVLSDVGSQFEAMHGEVSKLLATLGVEWDAWTGGAREAVRAMVNAVLDALREVGAPVDAIARRVEGVLDRIPSLGGMLARRDAADRANIGERGSRELALIRELTNPLEIARSVAAEWGGVFGGGTVAPAVVNPPSSAARTVNNRREVNLHAGAIQVNGVSDPHEAARHAVALLEDRQRAAHDAAHPLSGAEED